MEALANITIDIPVISEEEQLIHRCQAGDSRAFDQLLTQYRHEIVRTLRHILRNNDIEDTMQNVLVEVFRSIKNYRFQAKFSTWLYRVCINVALQQFRKAKRELRNDALWQPPEENTNPFKEVASQEVSREIYRILDTISKKKRIVFILHELQGMEAQKIAEIADCPSATVRTRLFHARQEFYRKARKSQFFNELVPREVKS